MAETFVQSTWDVVDFLRDQHAAIRDGLDDVLSAPSDDARWRAFVDLRRLLAAHAAAEEVVVPPPGGSAIQQQMARLESLDVGSREFVVALGELKRSVQEHAAHEDAEEFPALQRKVPDEDLEIMARAVHVAEVMATAEVPVGPFAAILGRARELIAADVQSAGIGRLSHTFT